MRNDSKRTRKSPRRRTLPTGQSMIIKNDRCQSFFCLCRFNSVGFGYLTCWGSPHNFGCFESLETSPLSLASKGVEAKIEFLASLTEFVRILYPSFLPLFLGLLPSQHYEATVR